MELMIAVTLVAVLLFIGASSLSRDESDKTRDAAAELIGVFRQARYVAARQNSVVVVSVSPYADDTNRGLVQARMKGDTRCDGVFPASVPFLTVDYAVALPAGVEHRTRRVVPPLLPLPRPPIQTFIEWDEDTDFGLVLRARNVGVAATDTVDFCVRPNGRIVNLDGQPFRPLGTAAVDAAGKAGLALQWDPIVGGRDTNGDGELDIPFREIEIPFNGLVRIPQ